MRGRRLHPRTRPFRYIGFWLAALAFGLCASGRAAGPLALAVGFCCLWPPLADRLHGRWESGPGGAGERRLYVIECAGAALLFGWASAPPLLALAGALCLLAGASALAGWRLLLPALAALVAAGAVGLALAPAPTGASTRAADVLALLLMAGFTLALAHLAFVQARRLHAQRLALADRSAALERLNGRLERYLPRSLRERLARSPETPCRWERCWLTVVFVDLVGFTELAERLEAEPLADLLDDYLGVVIPAAEARGGEVSKVMGDGLLVAFGLGDDLDRRARAAAALAFCGDVPAALERLAGRWRRRGEPVRLKIRAGVASGYCTLGDRGAAERLDFTLLGTPVNLASRLQGHATEAAALLDDATAALAGAQRRLGACRHLLLKGLGTLPVYPWSLSGVRVDPTAPSAIVPAPLTGD